MNTRIAAIQGILGVKQDGIWGPVSQGALDALVRPDEILHAGKASSFADPEDVVIFKKYFAIYKSEGMSDHDAEQAAFKKGDNGIGCWGDDTTGASPACALTKEDIVRRWGTLDAGKHKLVEVAANDRSVTCVLKDIKGHMNEAIIDLNPGACAVLGLEPPIMVSATWKWAQTA
jgi:hypothetical protein